MGNDVYIVEGGFGRLDPQTISILENEGSRVRIGQKIYRVNAHRFGAGLTKLPFEDVSLSCGSSVELLGSSFDLNSTWGRPEDARNAMVFTRDGDAEQGKRLKLGDTIPFETDLFLLAPEREGNRIRSSFSGARRVGVAGKRTSAIDYAVFEVRLSKGDNRWMQGKRYLEECGFEVDESGDTPELLWPPSLISGGDLLPLFERSRCIFVADMGSSLDGSLYIHTNTDTSERIRTVPLCRAGGEGGGFAILENTAKISFVTTRNWVFSSAVLLHPSDLFIEDRLHRPNLDPRLSLNEGRCVLELFYPCEVIGYQRGGGVRVFKITRDQRSCSFDDGSFDCVKVRKKLGASLDYLIVFEREFSSKRLMIRSSSEAATEREMLMVGVPDDLAFAKARCKGELRHQSSIDRQRALQRRAGR